MTEFQRQKVLELREKGWGYKRIATAIDIGRDGIRSFCRRNELGGFLRDILLNFHENKNNVNLIKNSVFLCKNCNKKIKLKATGRRPSFCSDSCRMQWHYESRKNNMG